MILRNILKNALIKHKGIEIDLRSNVDIRHIIGHNDLAKQSKAKQSKAKQSKDN